MSNKEKYRIEKQLSDALKSQKSQPSTEVQTRLLAKVRQRKEANKNVWNYSIPIWQVAALFLIGFGILYLFPNTILQEKTIVQTEIQPELIYLTDTIVEYRNIEKIVYQEVPTTIIKYVTMPTPEEKPALLLATENNLNKPVSIANTKPAKRRNQPTMSRNIRQDEDVMNFAVENQVLNSFTQPFNQK